MKNIKHKRNKSDKPAMAAAILIWLSIVGGVASLFGGSSISDTDEANDSAYETYIESEDGASATTEFVTGNSADAESNSDISEYNAEVTVEDNSVVEEASSADVITLDAIPDYSGSPYVEINNNTPFFTSDEITTEAFENYSSLDSLGRCGVAFANICQEIMPTESRGEIGSIKPTGWHTVKYDIVSGNYLYNRCHLIAYELAGENANEKNLITGTRYFNVTGMLPFENEVADYVKDTGNHVLYRVTPIFDGNNLVADGVLMEAYSVEDSGVGISFCVYCYNVQPGIAIDYATGDSWLVDENATSTTTEVLSSVEVTATADDTSEDVTYILNTNTMKFHYTSCSSVSKMSDKNKQEYTGTREDLISDGYSACSMCNP